MKVFILEIRNTPKEATNMFLQDFQSKTKQSPWNIKELNILKILLSECYTLEYGANTIMYILL